MKTLDSSFETVTTPHTQHIPWSHWLSVRLLVLTINQINKRNFRLVSMLGFTMALMASWEASLALLGTGLETGGKAGLVWITFIAWISLTFVNTSMAEMGSMAP